MVHVHMAFDTPHGHFFFFGLDLMKTAWLHIAIMGTKVDVDTYAFLHACTETPKPEQRHTYVQHFLKQTTKLKK